MGQSSNDTFPTAMHIATLFAVRQHTLRGSANSPTLWTKAVKWTDVVKIGRAHLQDATPLTVGQEWSGWVAQLRDASRRLDASLEAVEELAVGGTAVGTGFNAPEGFGPAMAEKLSELTGLSLRTAPNKFAAQGSLDAMLAVSAGLRGVAVALMKVAHKGNDEGPTLKAAALAMGVPEDEFDRIVDRARMGGDPRRDLGLDASPGTATSPARA